MISLYVDLFFFSFFFFFFFGDAPTKFEEASVGEAEKMPWKVEFHKSLLSHH